MSRWVGSCSHPAAEYMPEAPHTPAPPRSRRGRFKHSADPAPIQRPQVELIRRGFYPKGGGHVRLRARALAPGQTLPPFDLTARGEVGCGLCVRLMPAVLDVAPSGRPRPPSSPPPQLAAQIHPCNSLRSGAPSGQRPPFDGLHGQEGAAGWRGGGGWVQHQPRGCA